jgi:hypothetical protein
MKTKTIRKAIILVFLAVMLTSCTGSSSTPRTSPTEIMETALAIAKTAMIETQAAIPTSTPTATPLPADTPLPLMTSRPPTKTFTPFIQNSPLPVSGTPTVIAFDNGLTWSECVIPTGKYSFSKTDTAIVTRCLDAPEWDGYDPGISGERIAGENGSDMRLMIGQDTFLAQHDSTNGCCDYKFMKNGEVILEISAPLITTDPNRHLWNMGGKAVWELVTDPPVIIVDGVNFNEKYQLEGSFFPYEINGKLIFIARQNGKYHMMYDGKWIGSEFDQISMAYCCANISVIYGHGQYWFLGTRQGTQFVVLIR